ncbi:hypothetical protein ACFQX9_23425 [Bradyrhizobium sp. GCM10028915]
MSNPKPPRPPHGDDYLMPGREGGKQSAAGGGSTHREPSKPAVKTK